MTGSDRKRDLETKAIAMADAAMRAVPQQLTLEAPAAGGTFTTPATIEYVTMHCRLFESYYGYLLAFDIATTGMEALPPDDGKVATPVQTSGVQQGNGAAVATTIGAALQALLKSLPQTGSVTQAAAQTLLKTAIAGTGVPGILTNVILSLVPVNVSDWSQLLPILQQGFVTLSATN